MEPNHAVDDGMDDEKRKVYQSRLKTANLNETLPDPYTLDATMWVEDETIWPPLEYPDIYNYLVHTPSEFTHESLKAYKSLEAYNYFISGHVQRCYFHQVPNSAFSFIRSLILPGQRQNPKNDSDLYDAWVCIHESGRIHTAACSCMAGLGTACSHVAAIMYRIEASVRLEKSNQPTVTGQPCLWKTAKKKVTPARLCDINFARPQLQETMLRKRRRVQITESATITDADWDELKEVDPQAAVLTTFSDSDSSQTDSASEDGEEGILPEPLTSLFDIRNQMLTPDELEAQCTKALKDVCTEYTDQMIVALYHATKEQNLSPAWMEHRAGRITASRAKKVFTLRETTDPSEMIAHIMCYNDNSALEKVPAIAWGRSHEDIAREDYASVFRDLHDDPLIEPCGLCIFPEKPFLAATPDGRVRCSCCANGISGILEIKCPYKYRNSSLQDAITDRNFYLDNDMNLKKNHEYYFQVQFQLLCIDSPGSFCDFFVWTTIDTHTQRIVMDTPFLDRVVETLTKKWMKFILPELLTRSIEPKTDDDEGKIWCACKKLAFGKMVRCNNPNCKIERFHLRCVQLARVPRRIWFCTTCRGR